MTFLKIFYFVTLDIFQNRWFIQGKYINSSGSFSIQIIKDNIDYNREINERFIIINHNNSRYSIELDIFPYDEEEYDRINFEETYHQYIPRSIYSIMCGMCATAFFE